MNNREIIVCGDSAELHRRAAEQFAVLAERAVESLGRFAVALSGGSTPKALYSLLASPGYAERIDWPRVHLFWGDERCLPPEHPESNYRMVHEALLSTIRLPRENVHRMAGEKEPQIAAAQYETELKAFFSLGNGALPRFDLILLGLGEDGHTASLFPETDALQENRRLVVANHIPRLGAHRLTLTLPVLNEGAQVTFLVTGSNKAAVVKELLAARASATTLPAARVQPRNGELTWLLTADAAPSDLAGTADKARA